MISHSAYKLGERRARREKRGFRPAAADLAGSAIPQFIEEKIGLPKLDGLIERPRLESLIKSSADRFVANLISGRARTGKSATAAAVARGYSRVAWYTLDLTDNSWPVFANYLAAAVLRAANNEASIPKFGEEPEMPCSEEVAHYLVRLLPYTYTVDVDKPMLLVLDDLHHIFDAEWFADFFNFLLYSLPPSVHLLLLARGTPPLPLWRLRSKQLLNVINEDLLLFDQGETEEMCEILGCPRSAASTYEASFGRIGEILTLASERKKPI